MRDAECVEFLRGVLPRLRLRWAGYRRVRGQVCKRITRRIRELELPGYRAYASYLERHPGEWTRLDAMCRVTISRFYRDRALWESLRDEALPALARAATGRGDDVLRCWSAGSGAGEEPYTLALVWRLAVAPTFPELALRVLATDADEAMLERASAAVYPASSLRDLPDEMRRAAFVAQGDDFRLRRECRREVELGRQDVRRDRPGTPFDLILCRNLVFTYFDEALQTELLTRFREALLPGGALVVGTHESLPGGARGFARWGQGPGIYRSTPSERSGPTPVS